MQTVEDLQLKFPLSRRKLIKQLLERALLLIILGIIGAIILLINSDKYPEQIGTVLIGWAVVIGMLFLLYSSYTRAYIREYSYVLQEGVLVIRKGVFFSREVQVMPADLLQISVNQGALDRLFGLYDIHFGQIQDPWGMPKHIDGLDAETAESLTTFLTRLVGDQSTTPQSIGEPAREQLTATDVVEISERSHPISGLWLLAQALRLFVSLGLLGVVWLTQYKQKLAAGAVFSFGEYFAIWIAVYVGAVLYRYWWRKTYRYSVTQDGIAVAQGNVFKRRKTLRYAAISHVSIAQGWIDRLLGIAQVSVHVAGEGTPITRGAKRVLLGIPGQPMRNAEEIKTYIESRLSSQRVY